MSGKSGRYNGRKPRAVAVAEDAAVGSCGTCGKRQFRTRKAARSTGRRLYPGQRLSQYECGDYWHIGHLPGAVRHGVIPRSAIGSRPGAA